MTHWSSYLWIGSLCIVFAWCTYRYYLWAKGMDQINADHWEYLRSPGRMIEGVDYFVAEPAIPWVPGASRFPIGFEGGKSEDE